MYITFLIAVRRRLTCTEEPIATILVNHVAVQNRLTDLSLLFFLLVRKGELF